MPDREILNDSLGYIEPDQEPDPQDDLEPVIPNPEPADEREVSSEM